ncbi:hypothetical protein GCM10023166_12690 [Paeniglutamicibacter cryotolerans]
MLRGALVPLEPGFPPRGQSPGKTRSLFRHEGKLASILAMMKEPDDPRAKVQFNIYLPADLVRRIKHAAIDEGSSLSAFVESALQNQLEEK